MTGDYTAFLAGKTPVDHPSGLADVSRLPVALKPFQRALVEWALRRGRAAIFAGTGLGKTLMQLSWAQAVVEYEQAPVLILTPLAVAEQTVGEAEKFGIKGVAYAADQGAVKSDIVVTNYERFEKFNISRFAGIVLDESGIIKSHDGKTRAILTEACSDLRWRLCCTATPAPNDYTELGQHAEFLSVMRASEMLSMFFVHDGSIRAQGNAAEWRLKRHAETDFWRWLASWGAVVRSPDDLGFDEPGYDLPPLTIEQITVAASGKPAAGMLFPTAASTLSERIAVRRDTASDRVAAAVQIIGSSCASNVLSMPCSQTTPKSANAPAPANGTPPTQRERRPLNGRPLRAADQMLAGPISEPITPQTKKNSAPKIKSNETVTTPLGALDTPLTVNIEKNLSAERGRSPAVRLRSNAAGATNSNSASISPSMIGCLRLKTEAAPSVAAPTPTTGGADSRSITATQRESSGACSAPTATTASGTTETTPAASALRQIISIEPDPSAWVVWCNLNSEQDAIAALLGDRCFSIYGSLPAEQKVDRIFRWLRGERPVLLSKTSICGHGLNLQRCHKTIFVGLTDSFEQVFQAIRRCWRFGQMRPVKVYMIASELEGAVVGNLKRKEADYEKMLDAMSGHMRDLVRAEVLGNTARAPAAHTLSMELPAWL